MNPENTPSPVTPSPRSGGAAMRSIGFLLLVAAVFAAGLWAGRAWHGSRSAAATDAPAATAAATKQLWTCGMHPQVIQDHPGDCPICHMELTPLKSDATAGGAGASGHAAGPVVTIDPVVVQNMGLRVAPVERRPIARRIRVVGYLEEPEPLHRDINLRVGGWVERLYADTDGMAIEQGKPLFDLYSPEMQVGIEELIAARRAGGGSGAGDTTAGSLYASAVRKLQLWGLEERQIEELARLERAPASVPILAPINGHLTEKNVYVGAAVKAGDLVMRLADRHRMWLDAQVFESQLPLVSLGDRAVASVVAQPGRSFEGTVVFVHPHLDPVTRTALVRVEIPNEDYMLRQGMYATVEILPADAAPALAVPREAVIDTGTRQVAFVELPGGQFEPRDLRLGIAGDGMVQVLAGLSEGEKVVTSGQFLIDSESRLKEAIQKHLHGGLASEPAPEAGKQAPAAAAATTGPVPIFAVPHAEAIFDAYLALADRLGARQVDDTPVDPEPLAAAARQAIGHGDAVARALVEPVAAAADALAGRTLAEQRKLFKPLSAALIALADRTEPARVLHVAHCPMAIDDAGADWLQASDDDIRNPYFATQMKSCGEFRRTLGRRAP